MKQLPRRQNVIDPKFQYGLTFRFVALETILLMFSLGLLAFLFHKFAALTLPVSVETGRIVSFGATQGLTLFEEVKLVLVVMLLAVPLGSFVSYSFGVSLTHRVAGPVYRIRTYIGSMIHGDLDQKVSLRRNDYFHPLATDVDNLQKLWSDAILELQAINKHLHEVACHKQKPLLARSDTILADLLKKYPEKHK